MYCILSLTGSRTSCMHTSCMLFIETISHIHTVTANIWIYMILETQVHAQTNIHKNAHTHIISSVHVHTYKHILTYILIRTHSHKPPHSFAACTCSIFAAQTSAPKYHDGWAWKVSAGPPLRPPTITATHLSFWCRGFSIAAGGCLSPSAPKFGLGCKFSRTGVCVCVYVRACTCVSVCVIVCVCEAARGCGSF
jgi:hypothetical protein